MESIPNQHTPILVVDDDIGLLTSIEAIIFSAGIMKPALVSDSSRVLELIRKHRFELVLLDLMMPHMNGLKILETLKTEFPDVECVIITALDEITNAVQAMRFGAFDYLVKPIEKQKLLITIRNALERYSLRQGLAPFCHISFRDVKNPDAFKDIICKDENMIRVLHQAETAAMTDYNLMITGETGTGKELVARAIHNLSSRSSAPFIPINIASISKNLFEDSFFGHTRGAYTGAVKDQQGFMESAQGGTLFLDEIAELDRNLQVKLLRAIEQKQFCRIGSTAIRNIDVRIITATNLDLEKEIREQRFREDLFYRLTMFHIHIPPLRDRRGDVLPIAYYFLNLHSLKNNKHIHGMTHEFETRLQNYHFPGNVRELENIIAGAVLRESSETLSLTSAPQLLKTSPTEERSDFFLSLSEMEKKYILQVLETTNGNRTHAAAILKIGLSTLRRKLNEYDWKDEG